MDETVQEEGCDTTRKEGPEKSTDGKRIEGEMRQDKERRKTYSAAVIGGIKRKSRIYVGDSIVRKTDSRLSKGVLWFVSRENRACDRKCRSWEEEMEHPFWSTSGRTIPIRKELQRLWRNIDTS